VEAGYSIPYMMVVGKPLSSPIYNTAFTPAIATTLVELAIHNNTYRIWMRDRVREC